MSNIRVVMLLRAHEADNPKSYFIVMWAFGKTICPVVLRRSLMMPASRDIQRGGSKPPSRDSAPGP